MTEKHKHFDGKNVIEHLRSARKKGEQVTSEIHGTETPGYIAAAADSAKETSILFIGIWIIFSEFSISKPLSILALFLFGWFLWKIGRSSLLGWTRLERLHRLIEQERWEIQHHRAQEKEELINMYRQKGLSGNLLDEVIEILMADDNRLLQVMLEEELGLTLESYEHPLKQAFGAGFGVLFAGGFGFLGFFIGRFIGITALLSFFFSVVTLIASKYEGNQLIKSLIWNLAVASLALGSIYLLSKWIAL